MNKKFSDKVKQAALTGSIFFAGLAGGQNANAQNADNTNAIKHEIQQNKAPLENDDVPLFFQDNPLNLSETEFLQLVKNTDLTKAQQVYLQSRFHKLTTSPMGATEQNFNWMLDIAVSKGKIQQDVADSFVRAAKKDSQKDVARDTNQASSNGSHSINNDKVNITYAFTNKGLVFDGALNYNVIDLMPDVETLKDGTYKCGASKGNSYTKTRAQELDALRNLYIHHMIFEDLTSRQENGETLGKGEMSFMDAHPKLLKSHGLEINKKGNLVQKNPKRNMAKYFSRSR